MNRLALRDSAAVVLVAALLTVAIAWPVLRAPGQRIFGDEIVGRHHDPFTVIDQFSRGVFQGPFVQPGTDWPGAILARWIGPVPAYNTLVLVSFPLTALFTWLLAFSLTRSRAGSWVAALAFAFAPFHLAHAAYHVHVAQTQWIPLYLLCLWQSVIDPRPRRLAGLAASALLAILSNWYTGLILGVTTPVALLAFWALAPSPPRRARCLWLPTLVLAGVAAAVLALVTVAQPGVLTDRARYDVGAQALIDFGARWFAVLIPPVESLVAGRWVGALWTRAGVGSGLVEQQVALGWGIAILALLSTVDWLRRRREPPGISAADSSAEHTRYVPAVVLVGLFSWVCSLAPAWPFAPARWIYAVAPMFRAYARFNVVTDLAGALLAGVAVASWAGRRTALRSVVLVAALALVAIEFVPAPWRWRDVLPTAGYRFVAGLAGNVRLLDCRPDTDPAYHTVPALLGRPMAYLAPPMDDCGEPRVAGKLAALGFTHMLARPGDFAGISHGVPAGLRSVFSSDDGDVYAVAGEVPAVLTWQMMGFYGREHDAQHTWRWAASTWAGLEVRNTTEAPASVLLDVELKAFPGDRRVELSINRRPVQTLTITTDPRVYRVGPMTIEPGLNILGLRSLDPAVVVGAVLGNRDRRALTLAVGEWTWRDAGRHE